MEFKFDENDAVDQICSKLIEYFEIDLEIDTISSILNKIGFEQRNNYLGEETSTMIYFSPRENIPNYNKNLVIISNKRYFDLNNNDFENVVVLRDAIRFLTKPDFSEATTSTNFKNIYEEEICYQIAKYLVDNLSKSQKIKQKIIN